MDETCDIYDGDERCGKPAHAKVYLRGLSGTLWHCPIWLCAEHYDWWQRTEHAPEDGETA